ncbi:MAG: DUF3872 domain-containing protein [Bacteroidales bacterium]|jgi:hypothetical protein|nr:DUF3872 domain-containing protein [Bacteroidales bacterium]
MKNLIIKITTGIFLFALLFLLSACNDELDIKQTYSFTVTNLPVQSRIKIGETAEIRLRLLREGYYKETKYFIRYFQPDGKGFLKMEDGTTLLPNDLYPLPSDTFRLYYTSACTTPQKIDIYVEDNFEQIAKLSFSFQNEKEETYNENDEEK